MKRFSLVTLLLFMALTCVSVGWIVDRWREPEVWTLYLDSNRYSRSSAPDAAKFEELAALSISPGIPFEYDIAYHYESDIQIQGLLTARGDRFVGELTIFLEDPGLGLSYNLEQAEPFNTLIDVPHSGGSSGLEVAR